MTKFIMHLVCVACKRCFILLRTFPVKKKKKVLSGTTLNVFYFFLPIFLPTQRGIEELELLLG